MVFGDDTNRFSYVESDLPTTSRAKPRRLSDHAVGDDCGGVGGCHAAGIIIAPEYAARDYRESA